MTDRHSGDVQTVLLTREEVAEIIRDQLRRVTIVMIGSVLGSAIVVTIAIVSFSYQHGKLEQKESDDRAAIQHLESNSDELQRQHSEMLVQNAKIGATVDRIDKELQKHIEKK